MSAKTLTEWECDRCGETKRITTLGEQPMGWRALSIVSPPLKAPDDNSATRLHLCAPCYQSLWEFLRGGTSS